MHFATHLGRVQIKEVAVVRPPVRLRICQYLARVLGDKCAACHIAHRRHAPSLRSTTLDHLQRHLLPALHHSIFAQQLVAAAHVVALKDHGRIGEIEVAVQPALGVVPVLDGDLAALAAGRGAAGKFKK